VGLAIVETKHIFFGLKKKHFSRLGYTKKSRKNRSTWRTFYLKIFKIGAVLPDWAFKELKELKEQNELICTKSRQYFNFQPL